LKDRQVERQTDRRSERGRDKEDRGRQQTLRERDMHTLVEAEIKRNIKRLTDRLGVRERER
jgi:hypothetical protein